MNKLIILSTISILATVGYAQQTIEEQRLQEARERLSSMSLPLPYGGIVVKPAKEMRSYDHELRKKAEKDIKTLGYINQTTEDIDLLSNIKETAKKQFQTYTNEYNPESTHLRHTIDELTLAYTFAGVPTEEISEQIGVSPYLTYIKGQGWVGAVQFFDNKELGICSYSENNIRLSHGSVILAQEDVTSEVNDKTTVTYTMGTEEAGFVYEVAWYDQTFFHNLKCYNKVFAIDILDRVKSLAKKIDINQ